MKNSIGMEVLQKVCNKKSSSARAFYNAEMSEISKMRFCNNSCFTLQGQLNTYLYYVENFQETEASVDYLHVSCGGLPKVII